MGHGLHGRRCVYAIRAKSEGRLHGKGAISLELHYNSGGIPIHTRGLKGGGDTCTPIEICTYVCVG
jgi:hypothetical protein